MFVPVTSNDTESAPFELPKLAGTPPWPSEYGCTVSVVVAPVASEVTVHVCVALSRFTTPTFVRNEASWRKPSANAVKLSVESMTDTDGKLCDTVPDDPGCGVQMREKPS